MVNGGSLSLGPGSTLPYAGTLTVNGGSFNLNGNTQLLGSLNGSGGTFNVNGGGLLVLNSAQANTLGSALAGNGMVTVQGGGSLNLTGNSSAFAGSTVVSNASLNVGGSLGGNVFVLPGGTLSGTGSVGNLFNSGVLAPGNSIGTMSVAGNFTRRRGGIYSDRGQRHGPERPDQCRRHGDAAGRYGDRHRPARHRPSRPRTTYTFLTAAGGLRAPSPR